VLHIVFFARVKEELGCGKLDLEWDEARRTPRAVKEYLYLRDGGRWREVLSEENIICAVNHQVVDDEAQLKDRDELAFFPPVTGG